VQKQHWRGGGSGMDRRGGAYRDHGGGASGGEGYGMDVMYDYGGFPAAAAAAGGFLVAIDDGYGGVGGYVLAADEGYGYDEEGSDAIAAGTAALG